MNISGKLTINDITDAVIVTDTTDWASQAFVYGVNTADIYYKVSVITASGTTIVYNNIGGGTPDIVVTAAGQSATVALVPHDTEGNILQGEWVLEMYAEGSYGGSPGAQFSASASMNYTLDYTFPEICIETTVNCGTAKVVSRDVTNYGIYIAQQTDIVRSNTIMPPQGVNKPSQTVPLPVNIYGPNIYTGTWTAAISSAVTFTFSSTFTVIMTVAGFKEFQVVCATEICKLMCCIKKLFQRYLHARKNNPSKAKELWDTTLQPALIELSLFQLYNYCGNETKAAMALQCLKDYTGCGDCDDCSDDFTVIVPTEYGGMTVIVDSPDNSIAVVQEVIDNITYYHIQVSATIQELINSYLPMEVVTDTPTYLTITPSTAPDGHTIWTVSFDPSTLIDNQIELRLALYKNPTWPPPVGQAAYFCSTEEIRMKGSNVQAPTIGIGQTTPNVAGDIMLIDITDFMVAANSTDVGDTYKFSVHTQINRIEDDFIPNAINQLEFQVLWIDTTSARAVLRGYSPVDGSPVIFDDVLDLDRIYLSVLIQVKN